MLHDKSMPNESEEYRMARNRLLRAEVDLRHAIEKVAEQRRQLPFGGKVVEDYEFTRLKPDGAEDTVTLSEMFAPGKKSLILYSFMFGPNMDKPCPSCTAFIDGLNAMAKHVTQRANLTVAAKSPIQRIREFADGRGWTDIQLVSSHGNFYNQDYWAECGDGSQMPMLNVFYHRPDGVYHYWGSEMLYAKTEGHPRHVDLQWPLWGLLDLTREGRGMDWLPQLEYPRNPYF